MRILISGHTGFIGRRLTLSLVGKGHSIVGISRRIDGTLSTPNLHQIKVTSIEQYSSFDQALVGVDAIVHLAGRAHIIEDSALDPTAEFFRINTQGTITLAQAAITAGVKHFILISSIGAMTTISNDILTEASACDPDTPYGKSKLAAEIALIELCHKTMMNWTIIRPTLCYGPNNPGNMARLLKLVNSNLMLPFGSIDNQRSLIYIENLIDAIITCLHHPNAKNETFLVSDGNHLSTPNLIRHLAQFLNTRSILLPIPPSLLRFLGKITGKSSAVERLLGSLVVSNEKIATALNWQPPYSIKQGLTATAKWYLTSVASRF